MLSYMSMITRLNIFLATVYYSSSVTSGKKCTETSCCAGYHFNASGACVVCPLGLYGVHCSTPCPRGYYGELCNSRCQCAEEFCNATVGCINKYDCPRGYLGQNCSIPCLPGFYGHHCRNRCECSVEHCNAISGCVGAELNTAIFYIVIPVSVGLLCLFTLTCIAMYIRRERGRNPRTPEQPEVDECGYEIPSSMKQMKSYYKPDSQSVYYSPPKLYPKDWKTSQE